MPCRQQDARKLRVEPDAGARIRRYEVQLAALDKVALGLPDDHAHRCIIGAEGAEQTDKTEELMAAVGQLMRRG